MRGPLRGALATLMAVWLLSALVGTVAESRTTWLMVAAIALCHRFEVEHAGRLASAFPIPDATVQPQPAVRFE
jgi:hypothetical protein